MTAAILFDSADEDTRINHPAINGREVYLYALETFYAHNDISCVIYACQSQDTTTYPTVRFFVRDRKCDMDKPFVIACGVRHIPQLWLHILQKVEKRPEMYVFHDVRFPLVTGGMVTEVTEKAREYGAAMFTGDVEGDIYQVQGRKVCNGYESALEPLRKLKYLRFPAAVRADNPALHCLDLPGRILEDLSSHKPYLCQGAEDSIPVYSAGDIKAAEAALRMRRDSAYIVDSL